MADPVNPPEESPPASEVAAPVAETPGNGGDPLPPPAPPVPPPRRRWPRLAFAFLLGAQAVLLLPERWLIAPSSDEDRMRGEVWACPMLCVRLNAPGRCPVCEMKLERIEHGGGRGGATSEVIVPPGQAKTIGLRTVVVERKVLEKTIRALGVIDYGDVRQRPSDVFTGESAARSLALRFEVFDAEIPWLVAGQEADVELEARPGVIVRGVVDAVALGVTQQTRATRVRVLVPDPDGRLGLGTFARATLRALLGADGRVLEAPRADRYTCRVHPDVQRDRPGDCPTCRLPLWIDPAQPRSATHPATRESAPKLLAIPRDAVVRFGGRQLVYVEVRSGVFAPRAVRIGPRAGDDVMVRDGLREGEKVAVDGNFLIDSQLQLAGEASLLSAPQTAQ